MIINPVQFRQNSQEEDLDFINHVRVMNFLPVLNSVGNFAVLEPRISQVDDEQEMQLMNNLHLFDGPKPIITIQQLQINEDEVVENVQAEVEENEWLNQYLDQYQNINIVETGLMDVVDLSDNEDIIMDGETHELIDISNEIPNVAVNNHNENDNIIVTVNEINIRQVDMARLTGNDRLNDNIIEVYLYLLSTRLYGSMTYCFSTGYYPIYINSTDHRQPAAGLIRDLEAVNNILIPIFHSAQQHWSLIAVDMIKKTVYHFDSLYGANSGIIYNVKSHFNNFIPRLENMDQWNSVYQYPVPKQMNAIDCGVFLCIFARFTITGDKFNFSQQDIAFWRSHMAEEIRTCEIIEN